jgi:maltooligosyltrehalose trehalohydrolase
LTDGFKTAWGDAVNYDGRYCDAVRAMVHENVRMWIKDFHLDGLRLDAADQIFDRSPRHILSELAEIVHREGDLLGRRCHVFAETDLNDAPRFLHPLERGGHGIDGHWSDDFHHCIHVLLTGETDGYYIDFAAAPASITAAYAHVFMNDGRYSPFRERRHGTSAQDFDGDRFVAFLQNHDQIGNRLRGDRLSLNASPAQLRLGAGLLLLAPRLPLLFMGEEYGETNPFPFFCDYQSPELIAAVREGRKVEFAHFGWKEEPPDPASPVARDSAVLSWSWTTPERAGLRQLYRDLLALRRESAVLKDFRHPRTQLLAGGVLEVIRSEVAPLAIYFNLTADDQPLPADRPEGPACFRSEISRYGANAPDSELATDRLRPYEFQVFGDLEPGTG